MDEARANAAQIPERGRSAGAPAVTLPASLPDDVVRAICTYLEGHRGAARRLTLVNKAFHALVDPWRLPDVVWRAFGPLAGERHFEGLPPRLPGTSMAPSRYELLPSLRPFAIKISLVPRDEHGDNQERIKVSEATVRAYLATILK